MYVCICHNITEEQLEKAVEQSKNPNEALKKLNIGQSCGTCILTALEKVQSQVQTKNKNLKAPVTTKR